MTLKRLITIVIGTALMLTAGSVFVAWNWCRAYVGPDEMLVLIRKSGKAMPAGHQIAEPGEKGIQREAYGPGRYFLNPITWDWQVQKLVDIPAGDPTSWQELYTASDPDIASPDIKGKLPQVGIVTSLAGKPWTGTSEVVDEGFQGIQRRVLTPGRYRINPLAYKVELHPAVLVPVGCAGVVTSQLGDMPGVEVMKETSIAPDGQVIEGPEKVVQKLAHEGQRGVLANILQPGIYYLNPYVYRVSIVQIGYNHIEQMKQQQVSESITFPSKDGFNIDVEVTVVWGRHPQHTPNMINRLGDLPQIKQIILSQIRSICRNLGSYYDSIDFIHGEKREQYQRAVTETLQKVAAQKDIEILIALIHNIEVHPNSTNEQTADTDLKQTIQRGYIAREQELTKQAQRESAKVKADLDAALAKIEIAREMVNAGTRRKVAEIRAEAEKKAREIEASRDLEVAKIEKQIADLDAAKTRTLGKAKAKVTELKNQAESDGKRMMVEALGSGAAYNLMTFAENFDPQEVRLIYAGDGTLWTDLGDLKDAAAMRLLENSREAPKPRATTQPVRARP